MAIFLGVNAFIFFGWYFWLAGRRWSWLDTLLGAFVLSLCQCLSLMMLLASFGRLRLLETSVLNLALTNLLLLVKIRSLPQNFRWTSIRIFAMARQLSAGSWVAVSMMFAGFVMLVFLVLYGQNRAWDGNQYHIPVAALRLQSASLDRLQGFWPQLVGFPQSGDMYILWNLLWMQSTHLADAVQLPFWIFGWLALVSLALKFKARASHAILSSLIWAFTPMALLQAKDALVDLMVAALFWIGLNFAYQKPVSNLFAGLAVACACLLIGIKSSTFLYAAIICFFLFWNICTSRRGWTIFRKISFFALILLLTNGYWYFDNWKATGNPLWPLRVEVGPLNLDGPFNLKTIEQTYYSLGMAAFPFWRKWWMIWLEMMPSAFPYQTGSMFIGLGPLWIFLGLPSIVAWLILERKGWALVFLIFPFLAMLPLSWYSRYLLFLPGLGSLALSCVFPHFCAAIRGAVTFLVFAGSLFGLVYAMDPYLVLYMAKPAHYRSVLYENVRYVDAYHWLDSNTQRPTQIAYGEYVHFSTFLWGEDLRHKVHYIAPVSSSDWIQKIVSRDIEWVFVVAGSTEDSYMHSSQKFQLVFHATDRDVQPIKIYRVIR